MNHTQATDVPEFGHSLFGIVAAITLSVLLAGLAFALATWPVETLGWIALALVVAGAGLGGLAAPRGWPGR